ncbi:MAG: DUF3579 domain-containing protein [Rhodocyclaceae bacterium]|nr:DUF3579 domain-containing protein [Rhodocyclaceae bacterium]
MTSMSNPAATDDAKSPSDLSHSLVIVGRTHDGQKFRPSDWAERLCGVMSAFGSEKRMKYSPYVSPGDWDGDRCVFIDGALYEISPIAYRFLANFAKDNDLVLIDGVCSLEVCNIDDVLAETVVYPPTVPPR